MLYQSSQQMPCHATEEPWSSRCPTPCLLLESSPALHHLQSRLQRKCELLNGIMTHWPMLLNASHLKEHQGCGHAAGLQRLIYGCCLLHWNHYVVQALYASYHMHVQSCLAS